MKRLFVSTSLETIRFRSTYQEYVSRNTFSPVARFETFRLLLSLAALHDWEIEALDVKTAYLFGELDEEIYMDQPEGFIVKGQEKKVCQLKKSIYVWTEAVCPPMEQATAQKSSGDGIYLL